MQTPAQPSRPSSGTVESSEASAELSIARKIAAEVTPSDITLLAEYQRLRSVHPFHIPPLITLPTLYGAIGPQNVDKPLDHLVKLGVLRKYWVGEWCIGVNADLCALALEKADVKNPKRRRTDTSPLRNQPHVVEDEESAAREDIFGRFASFLRTPQSQAPSLASSSLQSYMSCSDADLSMLFHAGFLTLNPTPSAPSQTTNTRLPTNTNSTTYYISYPSLSSFLTPLKKQRTDLLAAIKRRRDKTLFERDLTEKETFVKGGGLPWDVVVSDLVGSGTLERAESVSGVLVRIVGRSRGDTRW
ncbi:hypothetical protein HDU85_001196 [Gaertneriomyces sp. JEL0708]|nr:hypothetical protein HDU85_001196 [Gaertneriomyces sp. JEL0708]